jgi:hypothetical protein
MSISLFAADLARRLQRPGVLDDSLRSGLFLLQEPGSDSWKRFAQALTVELEALGALVLLLDPADAGPLPNDALRRVLGAAPSGAPAPRRLPESDGSVSAGDLTIPTLIEQLMGRSGKDVVLICNQVSRLAAPAEEHTFRALKAARDRVNLLASGAGRFIFVATDTDFSVLQRCVADPAQAFFGAAIEPMPAV